MAERHARGRRPLPLSAAKVPEEGSPRPMWLKPPPQSRRPRLTWDQIIAGAAARRRAEEAGEEPPAAPSAEEAPAAVAAGGGRRRRRRRRRRSGAAEGARPAAGAQEEVPGRSAAGGEEGGVAAPAAAAEGDPAPSPAGSRRRRSRRGRRGGRGEGAASAAPQAAATPDPGRAEAPEAKAEGPRTATSPTQRRRTRQRGEAGRREARTGEAEGAPSGGHRQRRGRKPAAAVAAGGPAGVRPAGAEPTPRHRLWTLRAHAPEGEARPAAGAAVHRLRGPRVPGAGGPLPPGKVRVIYRDGRELTPCDRKKAEQEVALGRAKWVGASTIRLRYDPFRARRTRRRILERDGGVCAYCGAAGDTIDHLTPWSLGGRTTMDNCVTSCAECNFRRGNRPVIEFVAAEGITLRKMRNPVLLEYVRAARAQMRARRARTRDEDRAESS